MVRVSAPRLSLQPLAWRSMLARSRERRRGERGGKMAKGHWLAAVLGEACEVVPSLLLYFSFSSYLLALFILASYLTASPLLVKVEGRLDG